MRHPLRRVATNQSWISSRSIDFLGGLNWRTMKQLLRNWVRYSVLALCVAAAFLTAGCITTNNPNWPEEGSAADQAAQRQANVFYRGDLVIISYSGPGVPDRKPHEERVKEDGTVTPPELGPVVALNKTAGELQQVLQVEYNKLYRNITVTVKGELRYFHVEGEVKMPGPKTYLGETDVLSAISAASGFTEFANRKRMILIRPNGDQREVDYRRAVRDPKQNYKIYPGDKLVVPRSII